MWTRWTLAFFGGDISIIAASLHLCKWWVCIIIAIATATYSTKNKRGQYLLLAQKIVLPKDKKNKLRKKKEERLRCSPTCSTMLPCMKVGVWVPFDPTKCLKLPVVHYLR